MEDSSVLLIDQYTLMKKTLKKSKKVVEALQSFLSHMKQTMDTFSKLEKCSEILIHSNEYEHSKRSIKSVFRTIRKKCHTSLEIQEDKVKKVLDQLKECERYYESIKNFFDFPENIKDTSIKIVQLMGKISFVEENEEFNRRPHGDQASYFLIKVFKLITDHFKSEISICLEAANECFMVRMGRDYLSKESIDDSEESMIEDPFRKKSSLTVYPVSKVERVGISYEMSEENSSAHQSSILPNSSANNLLSKVSTKRARNPLCSTEQRPLEISKDESDIQVPLQELVSDLPLSIDLRNLDSVRTKSSRFSPLNHNSKNLITPIASKAPKENPSDSRNFMTSRTRDRSLSSQPKGALRSGVSPINLVQYDQKPKALRRSRSKDYFH